MVLVLRSGAGSGEDEAGLLEAGDSLGTVREELCSGSAAIVSAGDILGDDLDRWAVPSAERLQLVGGNSSEDTPEASAVVVPSGACDLSGWAGVRGFEEWHIELVCDRAEIDVVPGAQSFQDDTASGWRLPRVDAP